MNCAFQCIKAIFQWLIIKKKSNSSYRGNMFIAPIDYIIWVCLVVEKQYVQNCITKLPAVCESQSKENIFIRTKY